MADISLWSTTPDDQNNLAPPESLPENASNINQINNCVREMQAAVRKFWETPEWRNPGGTYSMSGSNSFLVESGKEHLYYIGLRIRVQDPTNGWITGNIRNKNLTDIVCDFDGSVNLTGDPIATQLSLAEGLNQTFPIIYNSLVTGTNTGVTPDWVPQNGATVWTWTRLSIGKYQLTHNMTHNRYTVQITPAGVAAVFASHSDKTSTQVTVNLFNSTTNPVDGSFSITLMDRPEA